jgi:Ca2+-binding EF-hand superfamily protein
MKNADDMLKSIIRMVDTSGDGKVQYEGLSRQSPIGS